MNELVGLEESIRQESLNKPKLARLLGLYDDARAYLADEYYPWVQAACPYFTDHGENHIRAVIASADSLCSAHVRKGDLSPVECYLLLFAIIYHDSAMVLGRRGHPHKAKEIIEELKVFVPDPLSRRVIKEIVSAHSGRNTLKRPRATERLTFDGTTTTVRPRALAAILRLADEISENRSRISQALLETVPDTSRIYWEYANTVNASAPIDQYTIGIDFELDMSRATKIFDCQEYQGLTEDGEVSLIEYLVYRIEKMNIERAYCVAASSGLLRFQEIRVSLTLVLEGQRLPDFDADTFWLGDRGFWMDENEYPYIPCVKDFFDKVPKYRVHALRQVLDPA